MSRNARKYRYGQIGIPRTQVLAHLEHEARKRDVPLMKHIVDLLIDRDDALYDSEGINTWFPRGMSVLASHPLEARQETNNDNPSLEENLSAFCGFLEDDDYNSPTEPQLPAVRG